MTTGRVMDYLQELHVLTIDASSTYQFVAESIISDGFMNRVSFNHENKLTVNLNRQVHQIIEWWYDLSEKLKPHNRDISVYRGIYNVPSDQSVLIQPIPFSTCREFKYAYDWVKDVDNGFAMKINVRGFTGYTFIGNESEGDEIILPAGFLKRVGNENGVVEYDFEPLDHDGMLDLLDTL